MFGSGWRHLFRLLPPYLRGGSLLFVVLKKLQLHPPPPSSTIMSFFLTLWLKEKEKKESPTLVMISFTESSSWYFLPESATSWKKNWKFKLLFFYLQWHIHIFQCWRSADLCVPTVDRLHSDQPEWWTVPGVEVVLDHLSCPPGRVVIWVQLASCHHILLGSLLCPCLYLWVESGGRGKRSEWEQKMVIVQGFQFLEDFDL